MFPTSNPVPALPPYFVEGITELNTDISALASACADAVYKSVQHFGDEAWAVGTLPRCETLADVAEVRAKSLIIHPQTNGPMIDTVSVVLKNTEYLRSVARAARQSVQLAWLLKTDAGVVSTVFPLIHAVGEAASDVAIETALALGLSDREKATAARRAALKYRGVEAARQKAQIEIREATLPDVQARMTRAALWYMVIAGEGMARVAARAAAATTPEKQGVY